MIIRLLLCSMRDHCRCKALEKLGMFESNEGSSMDCRSHAIYNIAYDSRTEPACCRFGQKIMITKLTMPQRWRV